MVEKKKTANIEITDESTEEFGKVAKVILPNKSAIYVFKDGWCLKHPEHDKSMTIPWDEINLAIELTKKLGYIDPSNRSVKEK